jgi:hypothetical protein
MLLYKEIEWQGLPGTCPVASAFKIEVGPEGAEALEFMQGSGVRMFSPQSKM